MFKQNLHIHTCYCDGKNTPSEIIEKAISCGYDSIGFSGHSYMSYSPKYGMSLENEKKYRDEIRRLTKVYADKIKLFCGIEYDMYSDIDISAYDYSIGSVHYYLMDGQYIGIDRSSDEVQNVINTYFGGDGMKYTKMYYETLSKLPEYGKFDIIGYFDLIAKHCETANFFDIESKQYLGYAFEAIAELKNKIPLFEVNTGTIARNYRTTPYPSIPIIRELKRNGFGAVITTDCHDADMLDCYYDNAVELLKYCGFAYTHILTENGFVPVKM